MLVNFIFWASIKVDVLNGLNDNEDMDFLLISLEIINFTEINSGLPPVICIAGHWTSKVLGEAILRRSWVYLPHLILSSVTTSCTEKKCMTSQVFPCQVQTTVSIYFFSVAIIFLPCLVHLLVLFTCLETSKNKISFTFYISKWFNTTHDFSESFAY